MRKCFQYFSLTLSRHLNIVYFFKLGVVCYYMLHISYYYHVLLKQYFSRPYKLLINLQIYYHMQIIFVEFIKWLLHSTFYDRRKRDFQSKILIFCAKIDVDNLSSNNSNSSSFKYMLDK